MQPRVSSIFGSYDLFAKAFPGIVFFSLGLTLLPVPAISQDIKSNGVIIAIVALSVIIFGFVSGQALHAVAVKFELYVLKAAKLFYFFRDSLKTAIKNSFLSSENKVEEEKDATDQDAENEEDTTADPIESHFLKGNVLIIVAIISLTIPVLAITYYISSGRYISATLLAFLTIMPPQKLKIWGMETLYPHRELFDREVTTNGGSAEKFKDKLEDIFDISVENSPELSYKLVMSYYERITVGRTRQFQATFSFCRSMWTTLLLYSILYLLISSSDLDQLIPLVDASRIFTYQPIIKSIIPDQSIIQIVGYVMLSSVFLFMEGERQNKALFVEYIFVDLLTISESELPETM